MKIIICGAGAIGSHTMLMSRFLKDEFAVVDFDKVETKNLLSQWFVKQMVGKNKATALKMQLQNFYGIKVKDYSTRLTEANSEMLLSNNDLIVDCFDNASSRQLILDYAKSNNIQSLHAGLAADGSFGMIRWRDQFTPDQEDAPGQATCENGEFLPLINRLSSCVTSSIQNYSSEKERTSWNVSSFSAESL